jgi:hypothetical protein
MSQLVEMFENSNKARPTQTKQIPEQAVNFIDRNNEFQEEYAVNRQQGDPTTFTEAALQHYDKELETMIIPPSFNRHDPDIPLNRYTPDEKYYEPGQPST